MSTKQPLRTGGFLARVCLLVLLLLWIGTHAAYAARATTIAPAVSLPRLHDNPLDVGQPTPTPVPPAAATPLPASAPCTYSPHTAPLLPPPLGRDALSDLLYHGAFSSHQENVFPSGNNPRRAQISELLYGAPAPGIDCSASSPPLK